MAHALTAPTRIELHEHGNPVVHPAENLDLIALAEANKRWRRALGLRGDPIRTEDIGNGFLKLRAEHVTGLVRIGSTDIEIAPKFLSKAYGQWQSVLWQILTVVAGGHIDDKLTSAQAGAPLSMQDLLAEMFVASYTKGAARGLPRGYQARQGAGNTLRGRLDTSRTGEWLSRPWELPYVADLLIDDTALARLLRWSAECLAATVISPSRARVVRQIAAELAHVGKQPPHFLEAQRIILSPQHKVLEPARLVGLMLLEGAGVLHARGEHALSGFLWDSNVIYENYVDYLCRRAASQRTERVSKKVEKFGQVIAGAGRSLETTPDVVFRDLDGTPTAVTDSKYKRLGSRPKAEDTYQVLTAGHVLGCQRVSLTYPVAYDREPTVWRVCSALGGSDIELTALPINLMGLTLPGGQKALINTIKGWLDGELFSAIS